MNTTPESTDITSSILPASWRTIFWILVNLCIGAMAQPGGRICSFPSRYRTYLRCSPLICGADLVSIMIKLLAATTYLRLSLLESVGFLLHDRFDEKGHTSGGRNQSFDLQADYDDERDDRIQTLETMTCLRWLWFFLGTLPSAIKLASMSGVGWAQTWGMMYLGSWVINELLIIFATLNQSFFTISNSGRISWPGYEQTTRTAKFQQVQRCLDHCENCLGMFALIIHVVIMNNILRIILLLSYDTYPLSATVMSGMYISVTYIVMVSVSVGVAVGLGILFYREQFSIFVFVLLGLAYIILGNMAGNSLMFSRSVLKAAGGPYFSVYVWAISIVMISVVLLLLRFLAMRLIMLGRNLLVLFRNGNERQFSIDYKACLGLIFFLSTIITSLFWYAKIYTSFGTSMPVWTGVFG